MSKSSHKGTRVKDSDKELYTKSVKLVSVVSDFVSRAKHGNSTAAGATVITLLSSSFLKFVLC